MRVASGESLPTGIAVFSSARRTLHISRSLPLAVHVCASRLHVCISGLLYTARCEAINAAAKWYNLIQFLRQHVWLLKHPLAPRLRLCPLA